MSLNQDDFRRILATPRTSSSTPAPSLLPRNNRTGSKLNPFKKPVAHIKREGRSDVLEHSHVDLGTGFVDRAKERRLAELRGQIEEEGHVVKGLDFELLRKVKAGEFKMPEVKLPDPLAGSESDEDEEDEDEDAVLEELLKMETELQAEVDKKEKEEKEWKEKVDRLQRPAEKDEAEEDKSQEKPGETAAKSRFKPVIDAKQLKQMKREAKRRKLAMQAMDKDNKPTASSEAQPKKSRAELLEQLRQIQAAKRATEQKKAAATVSPPTELSEFVAPPAKQYQNVPPPPEEPSKRHPKKSPEHPVAPPRSPSPPPRKLSPVRTPPPPVKVGDNMFSDSELSDYNPYNDSDSESEKPSKPAVQGKRNYFNDTPSTEVTSAPVMDPTIAAALRKATAAAAAAEKRVVENRVEEKAGRMSLGGMDGVYEFDDVDTWDGDDEDDEMAGKKRKRKAK